MLIFLLANVESGSEVKAKESGGDSSFSLLHKPGNFIWSQVLKDGSVVCGDSIGNAALCDGDYLKIAKCYGAYYDTERNLSLLSYSYYICFYPSFDTYFKLKRRHIENATIFNRDMCAIISSPFKHRTYRTGRFCCKCKDGYGLAAYSY